MSTPPRWSLLLAFAVLVSMMLSQLLAVVFGQITVRKLRKDPRTRDRLGAEFISGWALFNVASALARPEWLTRRIERGALAGMVADARVLRACTTPFDRAFARIVYWGMWFSGSLLLIWMAIT